MQPFSATHLSSMPLVSVLRTNLARTFCGLLLVLGLVVSVGAGAQDPEPEVNVEEAPPDAIEQVASALGSADYDALLDLAQQRVEIRIMGQGSRYSRSQAAMVLRSFFRQHPPERVEFSEHSATQDDRTARGRYHVESGGRPLALRVGFRVSGEDEWALNSIRIERARLRNTENG